jgi:ribonuclease I
MSDQIVDVNKKVNTEELEKACDRFFNHTKEGYVNVPTDVALDYVTELRVRVEDLEDKNQLLTDLNQTLEEMIYSQKFVEQLEQDKNELLAAIIGYRTGQISDRAFDMLIEKHRRV